MNKTQLVDAVAQKSGLSKVYVKKTIDAFIDVASDSLRSGERITLTGFGSFVVTQKPPRTGRDFRTGQPVGIPAKSVVKFRSGITDETQ